MFKEERLVARMRSNCFSRDWLEQKERATQGQACPWATAQRAKITKKVHKPPRNHYIEWPVFSDIGLNCESQGEKGRTCKKYKILIGSRVFFFHFIHDLPFSPGHLLESEERFVNPFCNFSPLCDVAVARPEKNLLHTTTLFNTTGTTSSWLLLLLRQAWLINAISVQN